MVDLELVDLNNEDEIECIIGQAGFIKTIEDLYEALVTSTPKIKFGIAFSEASGKCLVRSEGNDDSLIKLAEENALKIGAGHSFIIFFKDAFPINLLNNIKNVQEVSRIYCATANPISVLIVKSKQGRGIAGIIDGYTPKGIETADDKKDRHDLLRKFGYKL